MGERVERSKVQLEIQPHGKDQRKVIQCDEIHCSTGPRHVKRVKRRPGERFKPENVQYNKDARPNPDKQEKFHIFYILGYDFAQAMEYDVGNSNSKMNAETYIKQILPKLQEQILGKELILQQGRDSAHISQRVLNWMDKHDMEHLEIPSKSPNLSQRPGYTH